MTDADGRHCPSPRRLVRPNVFDRYASSLIVMKWPEESVNALRECSEWSNRENVLTPMLLDCSVQKTGETDLG